MVAGSVVNPEAAEGVIEKKFSSVVDKIASWLGEDAKMIRSKGDDPIFISKDGTRRIRFDIKSPSPHENPHSHVEELIDGKWQKSGPIFPPDGPQH